MSSTTIQRNELTFLIAFALYCLRIHPTLGALVMSSLLLVHAPVFASGQSPTKATGHCQRESSESQRTIATTTEALHKVGVEKPCLPAPMPEPVPHFAGQNAASKGGSGGAVVSRESQQPASNVQVADSSPSEYAAQSATPDNDTVRFGPGSSRLSLDRFAHVLVMIGLFIELFGTRIFAMFGKSIRLSYRMALADVLRDEEDDA